MSERSVEHAALGWFEWLGYEVCDGVDVAPGSSAAEREGYDEVVLHKRLLASLRRLNTNIPDDALRQVVTSVSRPPEPTLMLNNRWLHTVLADGIDVEYRTPEGDLRGGKARLLDFVQPERNDFLAVRQFTVRNGQTDRRMDLVVFVNGLPLAVVELKDPTSGGSDVWPAVVQLRDYLSDVPNLFAYNEALVASDGLISRVGSLTAGPDRFSPWRSTKAWRDPGDSRLQALVEGLFSPGALMDYVRYCITFDEDPSNGQIRKRSAAYHQFRAVRSAREAVKGAAGDYGDGRGGVVWHTQGSGKSLTMLMLSGALIADPDLANPTIVVVTDRNDLDNQLFDTFSGGRDLLRQSPEQAASRADLETRLTRASGGVIFTTIQKFSEGRSSISERSNVVVLADEAHRSQYGFVDGGARWMRDALPNATFVGFTGTPLERDDRSTPGVFGHYVDVYDIRQAIDDDATVPIYYEMRLIKLAADAAGVEDAERQLGSAFEAEKRCDGIPLDIEIPLHDLIGAKSRVAEAAHEIVDHFERRREVIEGKALAVCVSREACMDLYDAIVVLRPEWHGETDDEGFVKVVMTGSPAEGLRVTQHARTKARREALAQRFKDPTSDLRLVLVCDMWLTGFDCPPLHTMYLDKPLAGHNLMQAIARVNRVFGDKPGGVVVDFLGVADQLRDAVETYTQAGGEGSPVLSIQEQAIPVMERNHETLQNFFHGVDYQGFSQADGARQLEMIAAGAERVFEQTDGRTRFMGLVASLSKAFALCVPLEQTASVRDDLGFYQAVRASIRKRLSSSPAPSFGDARMAVRQVISGAVASDGVLDLFAAAGLADPNVAILSEDFLDRVAALPQKNLALETLKQLLADQIRARERVNIVQSRSFSESLAAVLSQYSNRAISTAQVIDELIALARFVRESIDRGDESGLTEDEAAFYDALANNSSAREVLLDDQLRVIARELANRIRAKASLDWTERETVRADMRRTVRRLLAKHGYPPDAQASATQLVIDQAEMMARRAVAR
jgi:type I restriction enzyme R subunit